MPRKVRSPKRRLDEPLTPALIHMLMTGEWCTVRLRGWVVAAQEWQDESRLHVLWEQHQDVLTTEAAAAGFAPFWLRRRLPTGPGFETWRRNFLAQHAY